MTYQISKLKKDFQVLRIDSQATHSARYPVSASDMFSVQKRNVRSIFALSVNIR